MARVSCSLALLVLSTFTALQHGIRGRNLGAQQGLLAAAFMEATFFYTSLLSWISIAASPRWSKTVIRHLNCVLLATLFVYLYRDIYPYATYTGRPQDLSEGRILWLKIALLITASVIIPLFVPRRYVPVDSKNPSIATAEQTVCLFSLVTFTFLDPIIFFAYRVPHLSWDQLQPLSDYDYAHFLKARSFKYLDVFSGATRRHLGIALFHLFHLDFLVMLLSIVTGSFLELLSPLALKELLRYIETGGLDPTIFRPWVWIVLLFVGPLLAGTSMQWYGFVASRMLARIQAIIMQLILEHSLRIRVKAEATETSTSSRAPSPGPADSSTRARDPGSASMSVNLLGKINNLITSDVENVSETRDILQLCVNVPLQILLVVGIVRMIKLFGWERRMASRVADKREEELVWIKRRQYLNLLNDIIVSMVVLERMRIHLSMGLHFLGLMISGKVSLDRVTDFLQNTELLDALEGNASNPSSSVPPRHATNIGFRNAIFTWAREVDDSPGSSNRRFNLKIDDELTFKKDCLNVVVGPTGSGKTSLLMALLSEMCYIPITSDSWYNLPREGGVAYAAQESWVQNETIRENIVFGSPFDEERYKKVLYQCALERDISLLDAADATEVGEKGITLSGGQKARVTLARAIYSKASIILLDDVLAALEAAFAVSLKDGTVLSKGPFEDIFGHSLELQEEPSKGEGHLEQPGNLGDVESTMASKPSETNGKLIVAEEIQVGHVTVAAVRSYFSAMGSLALIGIVFGTCLIAESIDAAQTWFLGFWASQYADHDTDMVNAPWYLMIYSSFFLSNIIVYTLGIFVLIFGAIRASKSMHKCLLQSVLGTTLRWIDTTPMSRIVTRFTQDVQVVDGPIVSSLKIVGNLTAKLVVKFFAVVALTPAFLPPGTIGHREAGRD
ncbi:hypothetical protein V5O48_002565 [Marasmius crinis-equi]|uniref:ABC transporter n=1 Tax=Marasmius crinis-equi TaxID=585013 RepID=A0ABR3FVE9_9AGAR